ncbi:MAG: twitch domain-containing radical SAM protein [Bacteroidia bacterium]|nr:twitch domain-containing radical SAM protein [Bacteroidia bacterium]
MEELPEKYRESKVFCMMPWVHLHVTQQGTVTPCCQAPWEADQALGEINQQSFGEIWQGEKMRDFRRKLKAGEADARCRKCYETEKSGVSSMRLMTNARYGHHVDWVEATDEAGFAPQAKPVYWDIRYSNLCNFRCRICGPWSSSRWHEDALKLGMKGNEPRVTHGIEDFGRFLEEMRPLLPFVEELHFAGGEPLIMPEHFELLKALDEAGLHEVVLFYNTNLSLLDYKEHSLTEIWKRFKTVRLYASLDDAGRRGELQRKDQVWAETEANARRLRAECPQVWFRLGPTVSVFNVFHLPDFHRDWVEKGLIDVGHLQPGLLEFPREYNVRILPADMKQEIAQKYARHVAWMRACPTENRVVVGRMVGQWEAVVRYMLAEDWSEFQAEFRAKTLELDELRGENTGESHPELKEMLGGN